MSLLKNILFLINLSLALCRFYPTFFDDRVPGAHSYHGLHNGVEHTKSFFDEWTVVVDGGEEIAQLVALELGYVYGGPVNGFPDTYTFLKYEHNKERRTPSEHTHRLNSHRRVRWAEQLFAKYRIKRDIKNSDQELYRVKRYNETKSRRKRDLIRKQPIFNDELWSHEWYLQDTRTERNLPRLDLNVLPVYAMGFNGSGIRISVLDDGIEYNHTDLSGNYDPEISWDCNDHDADPLPRYEEINRNSHGTRCAGEIAMTANNVKCGVGVAYGVKVGGVRMLDGRITDRIEGEAIGYAWNKVDIYSASWGPNDDGRTVEGPGRLAIEAFKRGITQGRNGKGNIYVWANGNGGGNFDNCNCDGYSSSIYTISIGSASQQGLFPWYGEICSSTLATAYSSGAYKDQKIATTDTGDKCTLSHTGTSAAAPLAAGIIALALQANSNMTWRDVQHLIVWTSEFAPLSANPGWQENGVGLHFDSRFGFGLLNAGAIVKRALTWKNVPEKYICIIETVPKGKRENYISSKSSANIFIKVDESCVVKYVEHVEVIVNIKYTRRGALEVNLLSPQGTNIQLLSSRPKDTSTAGFFNWPLTSVGTWGENPAGHWRLSVEDNTIENNVGEIGNVTLVIHGTSKMPPHMADNVDNMDHFTSDDSDAMSDDLSKFIKTYYDEEGDDNRENVDPMILAEVEKELLRFHHRKISRSPV